MQIIPSRLSSRLHPLLFTLLLITLASCSDSSDQQPTPAQVLLAQFSSGEAYFSESGLHALLEFEDSSSPLVLLQLIAVDDTSGFASYESAIAKVWSQYGGSTIFSSRVIEQILGERELLEVRAIQFPNLPMLLDALHSENFATSAAALFASTSDHAWVIGIPQDLPFNLQGGFVDPALAGLDREEAIALLTSALQNEGAATGGLQGNPEPILDMIVSDSPEPFYMINLIDFREQAKYADGRATDLSGAEANEVYGQAIGPQLLSRNSGPEILMPVSVVLTQDTREWEQAVVVRYASRDAFLNIFALNPQADAAIAHKDAGVESTLVYVSERRHDEPPVPADGIMFNLRYCEVLLADLSAEGPVVEVWGTQGLNSCPQAQWDSLNAAELASDFAVTAALMNGPRFFVVDWTSNTDGLGGGEPRLFGDIEMALLTTVEIAEAASRGDSAYSPNRVVRDNVWHFVAGRRIYELMDPEGNRYVMQSFSRAIDSNLQLGDLAQLGTRLDLPAGWAFSSHVLTNSFALPAVDGIAEVIQDNLANTYQRVP